MAVPYTFSTATGSLPLSQLDSNFATGITIGNTSVVLGDTITTINNLSLANVAITSVSTAFPNGYLANSNVIVGTTTLTLGSTVTAINGLSLSNVTISSGNVTISNVTTTNVTATTANVTTANITTLVVTGNASFTATSAVLLAKGTTAQQPAGVAGYLRFNTDTTQFEGYNGTAWSSVGGAAISNDTTTATNVYPLFAAATSGSATTVYTGNAKLLYKPSTGEFTSSVLTAGNGIVVNSKTVATSYTIASGYSGTSAGPITVASGQTVTVASGSRWVVL